MLPQGGESFPSCGNSIRDFPLWGKRIHNYFTT